MKKRDLKLTMPDDGLEMVRRCMNFADRVVKEEAERKPIERPMFWGSAETIKQWNRLWKEAFEAHKSK